jgi:hypothetical protein
MKEGQLVRRYGCRCAEGQWVWDGGERERWRWVQIRWPGTLAREEAK